MRTPAVAGWPGRQFNRARTRLAYGEFLRRSRRRVDARTHLRAALDTFEELKAKPWAERAATELRASGETVRRRDETAGEVVLTPQERAGRPAGEEGHVEQGGRRPAVRQPTDGRLPPAQRVHQDRGQLARRSSSASTSSSSMSREAGPVGPWKRRVSVR